MSAGGEVRDLAEAFAELYGSPPSHVVRAPGRVNLIGEHTDYNGLPVLPMAIQRRITMLIRPNTDSRVRVASLQRLLEPRTFELGAEIPPYDWGDWGNYPKAAGQALVREHGDLRGWDALLSSDLPVASGLSSSSALVIACALALVHVNGVELDRVRLAELMAAGERYVGLQGGGMDQAISLGGLAGHAARIEFDPLVLTPCKVPDDWRFVVAYSLKQAPKSCSAKETYNRRTRECREALDLVAAALELGDAPESYRRLMQAAAVDELLDVASRALRPTLLKRFRHVVTEGARLDAAQVALAGADRERFGQLMHESHVSLRDDYEVSSAGLDELVQISETAGAAGARLTGAGMGGCAIALSDEAGVDAVLAALAERYYRARTYQGGLDDHLFVALPSAGAFVEDL
jgi:galactokinase